MKLGEVIGNLSEGEQKWNRTLQLSNTNPSKKWEEMGMLALFDKKCQMMFSRI